MQEFWTEAGAGGRDQTALQGELTIPNDCHMRCFSMCYM